MQRCVSFCFGDGFERSARGIRTMFDARGLRATFCILASPKDSADPFINPNAVADCPFWRDAIAAGHEVEPHGWAHERLAELLPDEAIAGIERTFGRFEEELPGFDRRERLFHAAYFDVPGRVREYLSDRVLGVRAFAGQRGLNDLSKLEYGGAVDCAGFPDPADERLARRLTAFLKDERGWLVIALHGLDGEGWGPVSSHILAEWLDRLVDQGVAILRAGQVVRKAVGNWQRGQIPSPK